VSVAGATARATDDLRQGAATTGIDFTITRTGSTGVFFDEWRLDGPVPLREISMVLPQYLQFITVDEAEVALPPGDAGEYVDARVTFPYERNAEFDTRKPPRWVREQDTRTLYISARVMVTGEVIEVTWTSDRLWSMAAPAYGCWVKPSVRAAVFATYTIFGLNGLVFASWAARIPTASSTLGLGSGQLGGLLLVGAIGSVLSLPLAGVAAARFGIANTVRLGGAAAAVAASAVALGLLTVSVPVVAVGLFLFGCGIALWDVGQNIEGADVERLVGRTIMPRFHAAFSAGAFVGALVGAGLSGLQVSLSAHLVAVAVLSLAVSLWTPRYFLPEAEGHEGAAVAGADTTRHMGLGAWGEPRTLLIGLVVLGAALTEGAANDWVAKASVDGLGTSESTGAIMFAVFVAAMTGLRFVGGPLIDRFGRVRVLQASLGSSLAGLALFVVAPSVPLAAVGAILWGAGAALGFPMGMSAAADEPERAAARVSVVSTIGYTAFLAGPPLIGFLGDVVGIRSALLAVGVAVLASFLVAPAARERSVGVAEPLRTGSDRGH